LQFAHYRQIRQASEETTMVANARPNPRETTAADVDSSGARDIEAPSEAAIVANQLLSIAATDGNRAAFVTRSLSALTRITQNASRRTLLDALAASSDIDVLLRVLDRSEVLGDDLDADLLAARARGALARRWLLTAEGGVASASELGRLLGLTRQSVDNRRKGGRLLALDSSKRGFLYPVWQIDGGQVLPGLEEVLRELRDFDPWMQTAFLLNPNSFLGDESPLAELRRGHLDAVLAAASVYGEQVAA
jgi:hypothetical protein